MELLEPIDPRTFDCYSPDTLQNTILPNENKKLVLLNDFKSMNKKIDYIEDKIKVLHKKIDEDIEKLKGSIKNNSDKINTLISSLKETLTSQISDLNYKLIELNHKTNENTNNITKIVMFLEQFLKYNNEQFMKMYFIVKSGDKTIPFDTTELPQLSI